MPAEATRGRRSRRDGRSPRGPAEAGRLLVVHASVTALLCGVLMIIWLATSISGTFWVKWPWFGLGVALLLHAIGVARHHEPPGRERDRTAKLRVLGLAAVAQVMIWLLSGGGTFWPIWSWLGLGTLAAIIWIRQNTDRLPGMERMEALNARVDVLTRTRQGALDVQGAELRRIERDLHDGAQSRLVALSMLVGRAEARLADRPEEAALLRQARVEATAAVKELRDLARGIAPPVLADRGLQAAVEALASRSPMPVTVAGHIEGRLPPVIESAVYFVVAEALTNVAKHAGGAAAQVELARLDDVLVAEVADQGPGGADPEGGGLRGLRGRVEALDGQLRIVSPPGAGTMVRAEVPCGS